MVLSMTHPYSRGTWKVIFVQLYLLIVVPTVVAPTVVAATTVVPTVIATVEHIAVPAVRCT